MFKLYHDNQIRFYNNNKYVVIFRKNPFTKPNEKYISNIVHMRSGNNLNLGTVKLTFLEYAIRNNIMNLLNKYLLESGFDSVELWIMDIINHDTYRRYPEYGVFYKVEQFRKGSV